MATIRPYDSQFTITFSIYNIHAWRVHLSTTHQTFFHHCTTNMNSRQNVSEWLQNCKPTRNMSPSAELDIDVNVGPSRSGATQGQLHLPPASVVSISMTNSTTSAQPKISFQFFMAHKALMDPQNFLQLTTRYTNKVQILPYHKSSG